jgi:hypothetical protein
MGELIGQADRGHLAPRHKRCSSRLFRLMEDYESQRVPVHIVYPSCRNLAPRTRVVMNFLLQQTREIATLLEQGAEVLT